MNIQETPTNQPEKAGKCTGKWAKEVNGQLTDEETQMGSKSVKRTSTSLIIRKRPQGDPVDQGLANSGPVGKLQPTTSFYK